MKLAQIIAILMCLALLFAARMSSAFPVKTAAELLHERGYSDLSGKRIGLIANHTTVVGEGRLIDLISVNKNVKLAAIFVPEHGLRGQQEDGAKIAEGKDGPSGIQVYSLYGAVMKPTPEMLRGIDLLVFDIQDIGARFYTYISTMGLAMQAAADMRIPFLVLDRPNPLGGDYVAGPILEEGQVSFTGKYPIPIAHGMTVGELALMIQGEKMLPGLEQLDLKVVRAEGWQRAMQWPQTGLKWIRTSPNIPDFETALLYPGICLLEGTSASVGRGTRTPFKMVGYPGIDAAELAKRLNGRKLPGVRFDSIVFTPESLPGMSSRPAYKDRKIAGIKITVSDPRTYRSVETGIHILGALYGLLDPAGREKFFSRSGFDHLAGTATVRQAVSGGILPDRIIYAWNAGVDRFLGNRAKYLLY